jgi:hypothetical protein
MSPEKACGREARRWVRERSWHDPADCRAYGRTAVMTRSTRKGAPEIAHEIAPDVFCPGPWGRTQIDVYFVRSNSTWVLIDAGWANDASRIEMAARSLFGPDSRPTAILLTHCHPDHTGSALSLASTWGCKVHMHPDELPMATADFAAMVASAGPLDRYFILPLMRAMGRRRRETVLARGAAGRSGPRCAFRVARNARDLHAAIHTGRPLDEAHSRCCIDSSTK